MEIRQNVMASYIKNDLFCLQAPFREKPVFLESFYCPKTSGIPNLVQVHQPLAFFLPTILPHTFLFFFLGLHSKTCKHIRFTFSRKGLPMPVRQSSDATFTAANLQQTPFFDKTGQHHKRHAAGHFTKVKFALSHQTKNDHVWPDGVSHQFFK